MKSTKEGENSKIKKLDKLEISRLKTETILGFLPNSKMQQIT
jgi:hypothetical protein